MPLNVWPDASEDKTFHTLYELQISTHKDILVVGSFIELPNSPNDDSFSGNDTLMELQPIM